MFGKLAPSEVISFVLKVLKTRRSLLTLIGARDLPLFFSSQGPSKMSDIDRISVAVVDDHPILRQGLAAVLRNGPRFRFVAEGGSATEALQIAEVHRPDIII